MGEGGTPTINDVAARAGVSRATAARALGGYGYASGDVKDRVLRAAADLGYTTNRVARSMRSGRTQMIGFVCGDIADGVFSSAMRGICDVMEIEDYQVLVVNSDDRVSEEASGVAALLAHGVEGVVISPVTPAHSEHLAKLLDTVSVVSLDRELPGVTSVVADNEAAAADAVARALAAGHRRIALLGSVQPEEPVRLRRVGGRLRFVGAPRPSTARARGYARALADAGVDLDPDLVVFGPRGDRRDPVPVIDTLVRERGVTALFTADSYQTLAAYRACEALGVRIPEDVSLVGFSDADWPALVRPALSVVRQDAYTMGRQSAQILLDRLGGARGPSRVVVPTTLVAGGSVAPPRVHG